MSDESRRDPSGPETGRLRLATGADTPTDVREELMEEVRLRLERGELDSDLALVETALALLDGDRALPDDA